MAGISKRIFGSEIPTPVKKKLEAYQNLQRGPQDELDSIGLNPGEQSTVDTDFRYKDLINSNFNMKLDLSARTPFARFWTAVQVQKHTITDRGPWPKDKPIKDVRRGSFDEYTYIIKGDELFEKKITKHDTVVYELGNHILHEFMQNESITDSPTGDQAGDTLDNVLPREFKTNNNDFMKPAGGITGVTSQTEGALGTLKKVTVNFVVHNFHDYDKIYSKFFLRPGAQVFVDFGWDTATLYNPIDVVTESGRSNLGGGRGNSLDDVLYGKNGYVTESAGDLETLMGYVTSYDAKINANGSVECTVEFTSKNNALVNHSYGENDKLRNRIIYNLDYEVLNFAAEYFKNDYLRKDAETPAEDEKEWRKLSEKFAAANLRGSSGNIPQEKSTLTGVYWQTIKSDKEEQISNSKNIYVSYGFFEDKILNGEFGIGTDVDNILYGEDLSVRFDSSNSFVRFDVNLLERQKHMMDATTLAFIYPDKWDKTYNTDRNKIPEVDENDKSGVQATTSDKQANRIPTRELFISLHMIKEAFKNNTNINSVVKTILDEINDESLGVFNLQMSANNYAATEMSVVDRNYSALEEDNASGDFFSQMFTFKPLSDNSIVQNYDISFSTPKGGLQNMIAIQGMSPGQSLFADNEMIDKLLSLNAIDRVPAPRDNPEIGTVYLPDVGNYAAHRLETNAAVDSKIAFNFVANDEIFGNDKATEKYLDAMSESWEVADKDLLKKASSDLAKGEPVELEETKVTEEGSVEGDDEGEGGRQAGTVAEWYAMKIKNGFFRDNCSTILPVNLTLTIYGISSLVPGDVFKVDYMPDRYLANVYFQVTRVAHEVNNSKWSTTLTTVMRIRKAVKQAIGRFGDSSGYAGAEPTLTVQALEEYNLTNYEDLEQYITTLKFIPKEEMPGKTNNIDNCFEFKAKKKGTYKNTQWDNVPNDEAEDMFGDLDPYSYNKKEFKCSIDNSTVGDVFGADLEYKVKFKKFNNYYLITHGDKLLVMPKRMATKKSQGAYMLTRFNDFMGLLGLSPNQQRDADVNASDAVIPDECRKCENVSWSPLSFEKECLEAGGGYYKKFPGDWFSTTIWGYCYYDDTRINECIPNASKCQGYKKED